MAAFNIQLTYASHNLMIKIQKFQNVWLEQATFSTALRPHCSTLLEKIALATSISMSGSPSQNSSSSSTTPRFPAFLGLTDRITQTSLQPSLLVTTYILFAVYKRNGTVLTLENPLTYCDNRSETGTA